MSFELANLWWYVTALCILVAVAFVGLVLLAYQTRNLNRRLIALEGKVQ